MCSSDLEFAQLAFVELLLLVGGIAALAGLAEAVALDGLGQNHHRRAAMLHRILVRRVNFLRIVPAAAQ